MIRKRIEIDPINATRLFMVGLTLELESSTTTIDVELLLLLAAGVSPIPSTASDGVIFIKKRSLSGSVRFERLW